MTTLFTDLVDSTALSARLGPERAEQFRQTHFGLLRAAVASTDGQEVKNTGDGLMVVFSSLSAALGCAVAIQQAVERHNRQGGELSAVRVGVSHGEVEQAEGDYFGPSVVEAARLCAAADGNQILTTDVVRMLVAGRGGLAFSAAGSLHLKGLDEAVSAVTVDWAPLADEEALRAPLPARLNATLPLGLVGRQTESERLQGLYKDAKAGHRRLVLVGGEAGIGKTTLVAHLAVVAHSEGAVVLYGRCDAELGIPYQPWVESLRNLVEYAPDDLLAEHVARFGGELSRLIPELRRRVPGVPEFSVSNAELVRYELYGAVVDLLSGVAALVPIVIVLDDLHWADKESLLLLRHLLAHAMEDRLLIAGTYRNAEVTESHPLAEVLAELRREPGVERMLLRGLEDVDTVALVEAATGHEFDVAGVELAHALYRETDGNPFFTLEVVRHLADSGVLVQDADGHWSATVDLVDVGLPDSVREVIGQRVRHLGELPHKSLSNAAVIGRDFDLELLAAVCERSADELLDTLEPAVGAGVVLEHGDGFSFAHALIQHSLYEDLGAVRRRRIHLRVAQALEDLCGPDPGVRVGELARHWAAATSPSDVAKAVAYAQQAGNRALEALAPDDAAGWFGQALQLQQEQADADLGVRCDLLIGLGTAQRQSGDAAHRETLLDAASLAGELSDGERLARAALANTLTYSPPGQVDSDRVNALQSALRLIPAADSPLRAELLSTFAERGSFGDLDQRRSLTDEAVAMARRVNDMPTLVRVLAKAFHTLYVAQTHDLRREFVDQLLELTDHTSDPALRGVALDRAMWSMLDAGDLDRFDVLFAEQRTLSDRLGEPRLRFDTELLRATRITVNGTFSDCQQALDTLLDVGNQTHHPAAMATWGTLAGCISLRRGEHEEILPLIELATRDYPDMSAAQANAAAVYCELGRTEEARALLEAAIANDLTRIPRDRNWIAAMCLWADAAADLQAQDAAQTLYDELVAVKGLVLCSTNGMAEGPVRYHLGRLATALEHFEDAQDHFERADARCRRLEAQFWTARNDLAYSHMLTTRSRGGDVERARELLEEALEVATEEGYQFLAREARDRLAEASVS